MRKSIAILTAMLGLVMATAALAQTAAPKPEAAPAAAAPAAAAKPKQPWEVGQPAPEFTIKNFDTGTDFVMANEVKKGAILFEWFSSTCSSCRQEVEGLRDAARIGQISKGNRVMFINIDFNDLNIANYKKAQDIAEFTVLHDSKYVTAPLFGFRTTPSTVIVDKAGNIAFRQSGYTGNLKEIIEALEKAGK